jgi:hypothetical protein
LAAGKQQPRNAAAAMRRVWRTLKA